MSDKQKRSSVPPVTCEAHPALRFSPARRRSFAKRALVILLCLAMALSCSGCSNLFLLRLLLRRRVPPVQPSVPTPVPTATVVITPPTTYVVTPTPAPSTPTPAVPTAVRMFFFDRELEEFTQAVGESLTLSAQAYPIENFCNAPFLWSVSDPTVMRVEPDAYGRTCTVTVLKHKPGGITLSVSCCGVRRDVKVYTKQPVTPVSNTVALEGELLYRINIFLSNFSEQSLPGFNVATASDDFLIRFLEIYCKINHQDQITYIDGEECLSLQDANFYLNRFFGRSVNPYEGTVYMLNAWVSYRYSGGYFRFPAADGESYNRFTVVYAMERNSDGTYTVQFQNYDLDLNEYWEKGMTYDLYWLNNDQAANLVWSGRATPAQGGTAVVRDYVYNGITTYQILSYEVWNLVY